MQLLHRLRRGGADGAQERATGDTLDASFFVQGVATERLGKPARPEVLEEIARITRGLHATLEAAERKIELLVGEGPEGLGRSAFGSAPPVPEDDGEDEED